MSWSPEARHGLPISIFLPNLVNSHPCWQSFRDTIYYLWTSSSSPLSHPHSNHTKYIMVPWAHNALLHLLSLARYASLSLSGLRSGHPCRLTSSPFSFLKPSLITPRWVRHTLLLYTSYPPHSWFFLSVSHIRFLPGMYLSSPYSRCLYSRHQHNARPIVGVVNVCSVSKQSLRLAIIHTGANMWLLEISDFYTIILSMWFFRAHCSYIIPLMMITYVATEA